jgi:hypothetical protein
MRSLLAGLGLLGLAMAVPGQEPSGLVAPLDPSKRLISPKEAITLRDGRLSIEVDEEAAKAAEAAEQKSREEQQLARAAIEKLARYEEATKALRAEEDRKFEARMWGLGFVGLVIVARVVWWLFGPQKGRAKPGAAADGEDNPFS